MSPEEKLRELIADWRKEALSRTCYGKYEAALVNCAADLHELVDELFYG